MSRPGEPSEGSPSPTPPEKDNPGAAHGPPGLFFLGNVLTFRGKMPTQQFNTAMYASELSRGGHRRRGLQWSVILWLAVSLSLPGALQAQDAGAQRQQTPSVDRSSRIDIVGWKVAFEKPSGWVKAPSKAGAAARLVAAGDRSAQIEIRVSDGVPVDRRESFFSAFHARLEKAGFLEVRHDEAAAFEDSPTGELTEYRGQTGGREYRLVVWQYHHREDAWIITSFFPAEGRDFFYAGFTGLIASMTLQP